MTAIEVLAATLLASLMMAAVVGVLGGLTRQQKLLMQKDTRPPWQEQLAAQLEWDLKNSQSMTATPMSLKLDGYAGRDFVTGAATSRPTIVEYYVDAHYPSGLLLRREVHTDELTTDNMRVELVCVGASSINVGAIDGHPMVPAAPPTANAHTPTPVPSQLRVAVSAQNANTLLFNESFTLR